MFNLILGSAALLGSTAAQRFKDPLSHQAGFQTDTDNFQALWFDHQKLDHFNEADNRTFSTRYWVNDQYFKAEDERSPIFLYICGEWTCSPPHVNSSNAFQLGSQLNARLVVHEHRYYGESQPFSDDQGGWSVENLKYLTVQQALADIAYFIDSMNEELEVSHKWVIIGGSYPGAMSAWFKSKYDTHVAASWSSSGVIHAIEEYRGYDFTVMDATRNSSLLCTFNIKHVTNLVEAAITHRGAEARRALFKQFGVNNLDMHPSDFMMFVADIFSSGVQQGKRTKMCSFLTTDDFKKDPVSQLQKLAQSYGMSAADYDYTILQNTSLNFASSARQWTYQYCTEFGFFQMPNRLFATRSELLTDDYFRAYCKKVFNNSVGDGPDTHYENEFFGGLGIQGSNILFFTARDDPWKFAGMMQLQDPAGSQKGMVAHHIDCADCSHCVDLHGVSEESPQALKDARDVAYKQITAWLGLGQETAFVQK